MQNLCDAVAITLSGIYIDVLSVLAHVQSHDRMIVIVTDLPRPSFGNSWESAYDKIAMMMMADHRAKKWKRAFGFVSNIY